jgi:hypothetical protein
VCLGAARWSSAINAALSAALIGASRWAVRQVRDVPSPSAAGLRVLTRLDTESANPLNPCDALVVTSAQPHLKRWQSPG